MLLRQPGNEALLQESVNKLKEVILKLAAPD